VLKPLGKRCKLSRLLTIVVGVASFFAFWLTNMYLVFGGDPLLGLMMIIVSFYYLPFGNLSRAAVEK
jgi:hypothetical protein